MQFIRKTSYSKSIIGFLIKLLNKIYLSIIVILFFSMVNSFSENEPVDIWNIDKEQIQENSEDKELITTTESDLESEKVDVFNMQTKDNIDTIKFDETLNSKEIKIIGLYDPEDFGLKIDMWSNSNGDQLKYLFSNLAKINLSRDASELMNIVLLTNAYYPKKNISEKDFLASFSTGVYQREIIRPNMVNTFEDLVYSVTTSWCMLHHLDNAENIGPNSIEGLRENSDSDNENVGLNENHARELLELHTLSPEGKYSQKDVIEMAKVMTGWRHLWNNKKLEAGPIKFQPEYHEQGPYKILGKIYDIKDFNTVNQGKELGIVIKDLANHPATIRHVARKLCQHYICDEPTEEMIASIVKKWKQNDGNLIEVHKSTMEAVFDYGSNYQKFSMPELWLLQNSRMLGLNYIYLFPKGFEFNGSRPSRSHRLVKDILWEIGHPIYRAKQPNGFIDLEDEWLSPELIIRSLAAARRFADITKPNVSYDQDYFFNVIEKNFDQPENLLNLMKDPVFYADRFAIFANSPEVMRV